MKILRPDNGVTRNFMPHRRMFLFQALTPPGHEVLLIDGNAQPMGEPLKHGGILTEQALQEVRGWPAGLPIFGLLTPLPATPLYK